VKQARFRKLQPVLSRVDKECCSIKLRGPLTGFQLSTGQLEVKRSVHYSMDFPIADETYTYFLTKCFCLTAIQLPLLNSTMSLLIHYVIL